MNKDYYIFSNGTLKRKDNTIYFETTEGDKKAIPIEKIDKIHIFSESNFNTKMLNYISKYGIQINIYNYYGFYSGTYYSKEQNISGYVIVHQASCYTDQDKRMFLAKKFIESSVHHILRNLRKHKEQNEVSLEKILAEYENINTVTNIYELMGMEGRIRNIYYQSFNNILKFGFSMDNRTKQPPEDPVNAMISFGNSLMYTTVLGEIYKTQLNPTISYLHEPSTKRFSLCLDIAEIFKPLIIDSIIFSLINNRVIKKEDFEQIGDICFLNDSGKKKFITAYETKLETTIKHRKLKRNVSYKYLIRLECYKLIKHVINDLTYKPLKAWW